jgi:hypothetical protein
MLTIGDHIHGPPQLDDTAGENLVAFEGSLVDGQPLLLVP